MECVIPGNNMKGKALQALSKISDELYVEAKIDSLSLVTLNSNKTVCGRIKFYDVFFSSYTVDENELKGAANNTVSCKVHLKIFLPLLKGNLEKKLDYFKLEYSTTSDFIVARLKYKCDDITIVHKLRLMDTETLTIGVSSNSGCNNITGSSVFYGQMLATFTGSDDDITFEINSAKVIARNYCLGTPCRPKMVRTQINLHSSEFLFYKISKDTSLSFTLKPLRTITNFAEAFTANVDLNFEVGGKPLSMTVKNPTFEVNFIVATLDPYTESCSSVATSVSKVAEKQQNVFDLEDENWENSDLSQESSFCKLLQEAKNQIDVIPKSPESPRRKKAKTVFARCYDRTFHETVLGEVLAANSDSE